MPQTRLRGAMSERDPLAPGSMLDAAKMVAKFGFYGMIWLRRDLTVLATFGDLVSFVAPDKPITDSVLAFVGLEREIEALADNQKHVLELPAVAVVDDTAPPRKINFSIFWDANNATPVVLAYRSNAQTDLELELSRQIRARLMAESEVIEKSKELARANADLESFAAIVSHDLKAPLRHMRYLAQSAASEAAEAEQTNCVAKLHAIDAQAQRMSRMLGELFDYSSLGRKFEALEVVDTLKLATTIAESLPREGLNIAIGGAWPTLTTLRAPLELVLRNLISNALAHHDRDQGRIIVTATHDHLAVTITVSDDGPGIDAKHHASIFLPFRTLSPDNMAGASTGMGLAMVKKTLASVGGTILLSSDPTQARGTTFTVIWPKAITL